jgi:amino acid transporter
MEVGNTPKSDSYGLKSAILSPGETLAQSVALIAPTGTPLMAVPLVYALAGQGCAIAYLISTLTVVLVASNVNQFARISSSPGSLYTYIAEHTHPVLGMLSGWALLIAYVGTAAAVSAGCANYVNVLLRDLFGLPAMPLLWAAGAVGVACWMAYRDVEVSARLLLYLEGISILLILIVAAATILHYGWRLDMSQLTLQGVTPDRLRMGLVLAMFSSVGFESATSLGSEARDPLKTIPRAVLWSAILAGLFFFVSAYAEVLGFRGEAQTLDKSVAPMHVLAHKAGLPAIIGTLTDVGGVICFFGCTLACLTAAARVLFLMGRQGALHAVLGEAHETNQTPHKAVLLSAVAAFLPAGIMTLRGVGVFEIYGLLGTLATFGFVTAYIMIALAAPVFLRAQGRLTFQALAVSLLAVLAMGAALLGSIYPVPPGAYALLPYIYVVILTAGLTWSLVWSARSPVLAEEN